MDKILFVCTGNTCRSSMAEAIFKTAIESDEELSKKYTTASAGIAALDGDPASFNAIKVLRDNWGVDISLHRARMLALDDLDSASLIFTMTRGHKQTILSMFPQFGSKVFTLKEYAYGPQMGSSIDEYNYSLDITDPYGMSEQIYRRCAEEIRDAISRIIIRLKNSIK